MGSARKTAGLARWSAVALLIVLATSVAAQAQVEGQQRGGSVDSPQRGPIEPPMPYNPPPAPPLPAPPPAGAAVTNIPSNVENGCGAVAYTADGAFGAAFGMSSCEEAERLAVDACRRESTDKADCARGVLKRTHTWFAVTFCRNGSDWTTNVTTKTTLADVQQGAADWAARSKFGSARCRIVPNGVFHSGGLHTKR